MDLKWTQFCSGCWRKAMLSSLLLLHGVALCAHGSMLAANITEPERQPNSSSLSAHGGAGRGPALPAEATPLSVATAARAARLAHVARAGVGTEISAVSAEREPLQPGMALPEGTGGMGASLPALPNPRPATRTRALLDFDEEEEEGDSAVLQPDGTLLHPEQQQHPQAIPQRAPPPDRPRSQSHDPVLTVGFYDPAAQLRDLESASSDLRPRAAELQGGDPTSWTLSDFYDYLSPDYSHSTTESYPDDDLPTTSNMEDENIWPVTAAAPSRPFDDDGLALSGDGSVAAVANGSDCRLGYVPSNGTCRSPCELDAGYCFNGGKCLLVESIGAFCRCNMQDYIWNKGSRCESVITVFQVMSLLVGVASLTLLLFLMLVVFFGKRLHVLKTKNTRLSRHSKFRPQSEQHNDNFSLSTIAEGSHPNRTMSRYTWEYRTRDDPCFQDDPVKLEDPVKSTESKEDESLNIQNSLTPKHENSKALGEDNASEGGVTIDLELLLPKEAKLRPQAASSLHYSIYLYKMPRSPRSPLLRRPRGQDRGGGPLPGQHSPQTGPKHGYSPVSTRSLPPTPSRRASPRLGKARTP